MTARSADQTLSDIRGLFAAAHCDGALHVVDLDRGAQLGLGEHTVLPSASVFKVQVALAFFQLVSEGRLDDATTFSVNPQLHTPGPTGISIFRDPVTLSLHDLAVQMLTVSDNSATDILISLVGFGPIRAVAERLGLGSTAVGTDCQGLLQSLAEAMGSRSWHDLLRSGQVLDHSRLLRALGEPGPIHTSPSDSTKLLAAIWSAAADPTQPAAEVRRLMAQQLSRDRIAAAFPKAALVAAKSGTLLGVVRNEIAVVECPKGPRYAAAVFTRAWEPYAHEPAINQAIGQAVTMAIGWLGSSRS